MADEEQEYYGYYFGEEQGLLSSEHDLSRANAKRIDEVMKALVKGRDIPGLILAVAKNGQTLIKKGFGKADIENDVKVTNKTLFPIASMSKQMSAMLLAILMAEKGISWNSKVKDILPDFKLADQYMTDHATLDDIIAHRTGLPDVVLVWVAGEMNREEGYRSLQHYPTQSEFRDKLVYNNMVFAIVARVCEKLGGKPWEDLMVDKLFKPLGMTSSTFYDRHAPEWKGFTKPYAKDGDGPLYRVDQNGPRNVGAVGPAGSIVSTVEDMSKYIEFLTRKGKTSDGKELLSEDKLNELFYPVMVLPQPWFGGALELPTSPHKRTLDAYARGWTVGNYRGRKLIAHFGNLYGYDGLISFIPEAGISIYTNTNGPMGRPAIIAHLLAQSYITDVFLGEEPWLDSTTVVSYPAPWTDTPSGGGMTEQPVDKALAPQRPLENYVGSYENKAFGKVNIVISENDKLMLQFGKYGKFSLYPQGDKDKFAVESHDNLSLMKEYNTRFIPIVFVQFSGNDKSVKSVVVSMFNFAAPPQFDRINTKM